MSKKKFLTADQILAIYEDPWETAFRRLSEALQNGEAPDLETLRFINEAGERIRKGQDPKQAFAIRRKRGPKRDQALGIQIAWYIENAIQIGTTREEAIEDAADKFFKSKKLVEKRYYENRDLIRMGMEIAKAHSEVIKTAQCAVKPFGDLFRILLRKKPQ